jgi:hypothetical protein
MRHKPERNIRPDAHRSDQGKNASVKVWMKKDLIRINSPACAC